MTRRASLIPITATRAKIRFAGADVGCVFQPEGSDEWVGVWRIKNAPNLSVRGATQRATFYSLVEKRQALQSRRAS